MGTSILLAWVEDVHLNYKSLIDRSTAASLWNNDATTLLQQSNITRDSSNGSLIGVDFPGDYKENTDLLPQHSTLPFTSAANLGLATGLLLALVLNSRLDAIRGGWRNDYQVWAENTVIKLLFTLAFIVITAMVVPFIGILFFMLMIYRNFVKLILKITKGRKLAGLLTGSDVVWSIEDETALSVINVLVMLETDCQNTDILQKTRQLVISKLLAHPHVCPKLFYYRKKSIFGYFYWERQNKVCIEDHVRWLYNPSEYDQPLTQEILNGIVSTYANTCLPYDHQACWEILVGSTAVVTAKEIQKDLLEVMEAGLKSNFHNTSLLKVPVLLRVHHSIGDGVALMRLLMSSLIDETYTTMKPSTDIVSRLDATGQSLLLQEKHSSEHSESMENYINGTNVAPSNNTSNGSGIHFLDAEIKVSPIVENPNKTIANINLDRSRFLNEDIIKGKNSRAEVSHIESFHNFQPKNKPHNNYGHRLAETATTAALSIVSTSQTTLAEHDSQYAMNLGSSKNSDPFSESPSILLPLENQLETSSAVSTVLPPAIPPQNITKASFFTDNPAVAGRYKEFNTVINLEQLEYDIESAQSSNMHSIHSPTNDATNHFKRLDKTHVEIKSMKPDLNADIHDIQSRLPAFLPNCETKHLTRQTVQSINCQIAGNHDYKVPQCDKMPEYMPQSNLKHAKGELLPQIVGYHQKFSPHFSHESNISPPCATIGEKTFSRNFCKNTPISGYVNEALQTSTKRLHCYHSSSERFVTVTDDGSTTSNSVQADNQNTIIYFYTPEKNFSSSDHEQNNGIKIAITSKCDQISKPRPSKVTYHKTHVGLETMMLINVDNVQETSPETTVEKETADVATNYTTTNTHNADINKMPTQLSQSVTFTNVHPSTHNDLRSTSPTVRISNKLDETRLHDPCTTSPTNKLNVRANAASINRPAPTNGSSILCSGSTSYLNCNGGYNFDSPNHLTYSDVKYGDFDTLVNRQATSGLSKRVHEYCPQSAACCGNDFKEQFNHADVINDQYTHRSMTPSDMHETYGSQLQCSARPECACSVHERGIQRPRSPCSYSEQTNRANSPTQGKYDRPIPDNSNKCEYRLKGYDCKEIRLTPESGLQVLANNENDSTILSNKQRQLSNETYCVLPQQESLKGPTDNEVVLCPEFQSNGRYTPTVNDNYITTVHSKDVTRDQNNSSEMTNAHKHLDQWLGNEISQGTQTSPINSQMRHRNVVKKNSNIYISPLHYENSVSIARNCADSHKTAINKLTLGNPDIRNKELQDNTDDQFTTIPLVFQVENDENKPKNTYGNNTAQLRKLISLILMSSFMLADAIIWLIKKIRFVSYCTVSFVKSRCINWSDFGMKQKNAAQHNKYIELLKTINNNKNHGVPTSFLKKLLQNLHSISALTLSPAMLIHQTLMRNADNNALHGPKLSGQKIMTWYSDTNEEDSLLQLIKDVKHKCQTEGIRFTDILLTAVSASLENYYLNYQGYQSIPSNVTVVIPARMGPLSINRKQVIVSHKNGLKNGSSKAKHTTHSNTKELPTYFIVSGDKKPNQMNQRAIEKGSFGNTGLKIETVLKYVCGNKTDGSYNLPKYTNTLERQPMPTIYEEVKNSSGTPESKSPIMLKSDYRNSHKHSNVETGSYLRDTVWKQTDISINQAPNGLDTKLGLTSINIEETHSELHMENQFSVAMMNLPVTTEDTGEELVKPFTPSSRLKAVSYHASMLRRSPDYQINYWLLRVVASLLPAPLLPYLLSSTQSTLVLSNMMGPPGPVSLAGLPLTDLVFWVPHKGTTGVGITAMSYNGKLQLGLSIDKALVSCDTDARMILDGIVMELKNLYAVKSEPSSSSNKQMMTQ